MVMVLDANLSRGVYSPDADSLEIPIFEGLISSGILLLLMVPVVIIPQTNKFLVWIQIALLVVAVGFAVLNGFGWALPNHYLIAAAYLPVLITCIWLIVIRTRKLSSPVVLQHRNEQENP